ncbi:MAG: hypothetical protein KGK03_01410 [Candidatus Omnitrophica bacterium]|nr:hypothetical protein [Candidatus Omnitrophota bacterium]
MRITNKKAASILEFVGLFLIIITAFLIMRNYIQRGIYGASAKAGRSFAYGRQYDPQKTIECAFDDVTNQWYDYNCFEYYKSLDGCNNVSCRTNIIVNNCGATSGSYCNNLGAP